MFWLVSLCLVFNEWDYLFLCIPRYASHSLCLALASVVILTLYGYAYTPRCFEHLSRDILNYIEKMVGGICKVATFCLYIILNWRRSVSEIYSLFLAFHFCKEILNIRLHYFHYFMLFIRVLRHLIAFYHWLVMGGSWKWHDLRSPISKSRDIGTNHWYLCLYCTLRVSKSLDLWCVFDRLSNFEKCNLRSGHFMWPGGVTFGVIGSSFFWKCVKLLSEQLWLIWRR